MVERGVVFVFGFGVVGVLEVVETFHDGFYEDLVTEKLGKDKADTEDGFPETADVGEEVVDVLDTSLIDGRLAVFFEVEMHVYIICQLLQILLYTQRRIK
jgi:hypothetical protein